MVLFLYLIETQGTVLTGLHIFWGGCKDLANIFVLQSYMSVIVIFYSTVLTCLLLISGWLVRGLSSSHRVVVKGRIFFWIYYLQCLVNWLWFSVFFLCYSPLCQFSVVPHRWSEGLILATNWSCIQLGVTLSLRKTWKYINGSHTVTQWDLIDTVVNYVRTLTWKFTRAKLTADWFTLFTCCFPPRSH